MMLTPAMRSFVAQMESGVEAVADLLGSQSTISVRDIKSALWESYFAVDEAVDWLLRKSLHSGHLPTHPLTSTTLLTVRLQPDRGAIAQGGRPEKGSR